MCIRDSKNIKDSSSCVVVKESFGNALVPYLTDHFSKIYVIDYRYWNGKLSHLVKDKKIQKIFFINNISMTRNSYLVGKLNQQIRWSLYGNKAEERITMVFSSVVFLFLFLPAVIALYIICPAKLRNGLLFAVSLFFYAWGEPVYIWIMLFSCLLYTSRCV